MQGSWNPSRDRAGSGNDLDLTATPVCIRPETDWFFTEVQQGASASWLWFSLQLSRNRAQELCDAFADRAADDDFAGLKAGGAVLAPASYAALRLAIAAAKADPVRAQALDPMKGMLGTDILVPSGACDALQSLVAPGVLEIADAGLALDTGEPPTPIRLDPGFHSKLDVLQGPVPDGSAVIIAIVDDGVGIANHRFRKEKGARTRVEHFLDMALLGAPPASGGADEVLGRSWTAADIDKLLAAYPDDEERVYRAMGLIDPRYPQRQPLRAAVSHGTHVLGAAAGYDWRSDGEAALAKRPIIAVQPTLQSAENRSDPWMPLSLKRALDWILVKADALSAEWTGGKRRLPLIVNCSFSSMAGPQDGWSDVERRVAQFVRTYRANVPELCTVVMSAGNSRLLRAAARIPIDKDRVSLPWRVLPNDRTPSFAQVWLPGQPQDTPQQVRVALRPPADDSPVMFSVSPERFSVLDRAVDWTVGSDVRARLYHQRVSRPGDRRRECITIAIRPTDDDGAPTPVVPAGLWHIDIEPTDGMQGPLDADLHVHRDDVGLFARGKGRQPYFDDPNYRQVELVGGRPAADGPPPAPGPAAVRTEGTLNAYGYGEGTVLVGGYRSSDNKLAPYSGSGAQYLRRRGKDNLDGPDLAAVTDESPALPGVLGTGTYSGSAIRLNGTSVAAPAAVRALADEIAKGRSINTLKASIAPAIPPPRPPKGVAMGIGKGETPPPSPEPDDPLRVGAGRLPFEPSRRAAG